MTPGSLRISSSTPQKQPPASVAFSVFAALVFLNSGRYCPYPSASSLSTGTNRSDAEFMQYRRPVGCGPSSKTCPRWESACLERTSVRDIQSFLSVFSTTLLLSSGRVKLGQPVPDSNLSSDENSGSPDTMST